jgi:DNA-binding transcriptional MerR regulator
MGVKSYTIGELARLSGQSVRRIRFYSDKGLLPSLRTESNYRIYTDTEFAKLDLILALREAGVSLDAIGKLFRQRLSLREVLLTRLDILEAEIATKRRAATILRAALRTPELTDDDLRRLWAMSNINKQQMHALVQRFVDGTTEGAELGERWRYQMVEASTPDLPENPTAEQLAAWGELATMLMDETFIQEVRQTTAGHWNHGLDQDAYRDAAKRVFEKACDAVARNVSRSSAEAAQIVRQWVKEGKRASGRALDSDFIADQLANFQLSTGRMGRYGTLVAQVRGIPHPQAARQGWCWLYEAVKAGSL